MPSIKKLRAIAHNIAHSYLSLMKYDGAEYTPNDFIEGNRIY